MKAPITLLVDADIVAFKFASSNQENYQWSEDVLSVHVEPLEDVTAKVDEWLAELKETLKADEMIICLSCPHDDNFRLGVLPSYKGNRDYDNRPVLLGPLKQHMADNYRTYERPSLEADDVMGILSTHPTLIPGKKIIVSEDKDMQTIPGWLYNPAKDTVPRLIAAEDADYYHLYQTLTGDATDFYKGCPGIGPVKAEKALQRDLTVMENWVSICALYATKKLTEEDALVQARCAKILRHTDYDFREKKVIPWNPPAT